MRKGLIHIAVLCWLIFVTAAPAVADTAANLLGDESDGSRAIPVHLAPLLDEEGEKITPADEPLLPFSMRRTCGDCHSVETISSGWHFNAADANVSVGRVGQPWIFVDTGTCTQIPLSHRPWQGTFKPKQLGLTSWKFVQYFGRHTPGGGVGELDSDNPDEMMRQFVSGKLEINCLSCHDADPGHDQAEYADQVARQNFRWAAAAACSFASVSGSAKDMPDTYDPLMPEMLDEPTLLAPTVRYRENAFDHKNRVFFNIARKVPAERCYFCHSNVNLDKTTTEKWTIDEDVHLSAGLTCVDCHRNGLDHNITRGYESEASVSANPLAAASSCQGCHLGEKSSIPTASRLGAPVPKHPGIPPVHFDKLTCTACHSGLWPSEKTHRTKTSRAHGLGTHNVNKSADALPHIMAPVFAKGTDGKIAPHKLLWPAFWATLKNGKITPIELETVKRTPGKILADIKPAPSGDWPALTEQHITEALKSLQKTVDDRPVYISAGKVYGLDESAQLYEEQHPAAKPYLWPIAHNVRPAAQSLGSHGSNCSDCHSTDAPFFFGNVAVDSPLPSQQGLIKRMVEFQDIDAFYIKAFNFSFVFRFWLKLVTLGSCALLAVVLLLYALKALGRITKILAGED